MVQVPRVSPFCDAGAFCSLQAWLIHPSKCPLRRTQKCGPWTMGAYTLVGP